MEIVLVKQTDARLSEEDQAVVRRFLFEHLTGATPKDARGWNRFCRALNEAGSGEYFSIKLERQRSGKFHRLTMLVLTKVFKAQERFEDFRIFRQFVKLGAGFCDYLPTPNGELRAVPKSQNFDECSEEDVHEFFENAIKFLRSERACKTLWPDAPVWQSAAGMDEIFKGFDL